MFLRIGSPSRRTAGFIDPCIPTVAHKPPAGPEWVHEIKHDGFRLIVCRRAGRVRLFTRRGFDWSERYPLIVAAADALTQDATMDGEVVVCDDAGVANFERLQGRAHDRAAFLYAFDLLELDGEDWRPCPLEARKESVSSENVRWSVKRSRLPSPDAFDGGQLRLPRHTIGNLLWTGNKSGPSPIVACSGPSHPSFPVQRSGPLGPGDFGRRGLS
jgi:hypothetical protein